MDAKLILIRKRTNGDNETTYLGSYRGNDDMLGRVVHAGIDAEVAEKIIGHKEMTEDEKGHSLRLSKACTVDGQIVADMQTQVDSDGEVVFDEQGLAKQVQATYIPKGRKERGDGRPNHIPSWRFSGAVEFPEA